MGFFKEFKEDFSDAVDELVPGETPKTEDDDVMVNTIDEDIDIDSELSKLDGLLEKAQKKADGAEVKAKAEPVEKNMTTSNGKEETKTMDTTTQNSMQSIPETAKAMNTAAAEVSDENAVITQGMTITGDLESTGSIEVEGTIKGNVKCNGKLVVTGTIRGNSASSEFFADAAKIEGEVASTGTVKVGAGSVIIGNISATSAVIAGAVKGDIDVQGPVVVDTSAVVMGNIKSRSVQINNGAVIEGFCSQSYADVDVESVFGGEQ